MLFHEHHLLRAIARMSITFAGNCTILRESARAPIPLVMNEKISIDIDKLRADMTAAVEASSARKFSLKATGGRNPDFYRNFMNHGRDKRISADVFLGIVTALERNPSVYAKGFPAEAVLPNATVLTTVFATLLDSVGVDPYTDEIARKLALRFPNALRRAEALRAGLLEDDDSSHEEAAPDRGAGLPGS